MNIEYYRLLNGPSNFKYGNGDYKIEITKVRNTNILMFELWYGTPGEEGYIYVEELFETDKPFQYYKNLVKILMDNISTEKTPAQNIVHIRGEITK